MPALFRIAIPCACKVYIFILSLSAPIVLRLRTAHVAPALKRQARSTPVDLHRRKRSLPKEAYQTASRVVKKHQDCVIQPSCSPKAPHLVQTSTAIAKADSRRYVTPAPCPSAPKNPRRRRDYRERCKYR